MRFWVFAAFIALMPQAARALPLTATHMVVLDAGHEPEEGLIRPGAAAEKEFCLKIIAALKEIIERENGQSVTALIISAADKEPRQREKAAAANQAGGDLYLAIHAVPAGTGQTRGLGIFIPNPGAAPARSWRSASRNFSGNNRLFAEKLKAALQSVYPDARVFATAVPLYIFHGIDMPAAAIEAAPPDGPNASAPDFYARAAQALYDAVAEFEKKR